MYFSAVHRSINSDGSGSSGKISRKRLASQLSDDEGIPGVSQLVNLSENEIAIQFIPALAKKTVTYMKYFAV